MPTVITKAIVDKARADQLRGGAEYQMTDARAPGLELRVRPRGVMWNFRFKVAGKSHRLAMASVDLLSIAEARQLATDAAAVVRSGGVLSEEWMTKRLVELGKIEAAPEPEQLLMTFSEGRAAYLEMVKAAKSKGTLDDYRQTLNHPKLAQLDDRQLHTISREELAEIVKEVHVDGYETQADHFCRVLRPFWTWLGSDAEVRKTGVEPGIMDRLKPPPRSRVDDDEDEDDEDVQGTYVPSITEMAEAILCGRVAYRPAYACAIELLTWTVQRRRAIVEARIDDFKQLDNGKTGLWKVPAASRKGRKKNGKKKRPHVVPLPEPVWNCVVAAATARGETDSPWLFPAKSESGHISESTLTHYLSYLPGIKASPHDMRRGFATYGEAALELRRSDTDFLLDHEDEPSWKEVTHRSASPAATMTGEHYALHDGTHRTWKIMDAWTAALQAEIDRLLAERPALFSAWWVKGEVAKNKKLEKAQRNRYEPLMPIAAE